MFFKSYISDLSYFNWIAVKTMLLPIIIRGWSEFSIYLGYIIDYSRYDNTNLLQTKYFSSIDLYLLAIQFCVYIYFSLKLMGTCGVWYAVGRMECKIGYKNIVQSWVIYCKCRNTMYCPLLVNQIAQKQVELWRHYQYHTCNGVGFLKKLRDNTVILTRL